VRSRTGFTLIEVLVSIVLTSVVALLVYGAAAVARDTQARTGAELRSLHHALTMRLLLETALAGAGSAPFAPDSVFVLESRSGTGGLPQDRLTFVTSGDLPPLNPGVEWLVRLALTPAGLCLYGKPFGTRLPERILAKAPGVTGLAIRVRDGGFGVGWSRTWEFPDALPDAVELTYWTQAGPVGVPIRVALPLGYGQ
jgi:prepilin-type N-terminal cleavage/methylation domain-containing protein